MPELQDIVFRKDYYNELIVADGYANYAKLSDALAAITDASATKRYLIKVYGRIAETVQINAKSYVDVIGYNADITVQSNAAIADISALEAINISNARWQNITIRRAGTIVGGIRTLAFSIKGTTDDTFILQDCKFINQVIGGQVVGGRTGDTAAPIFNDCEIRSNGTPSSWSVGAWCAGDSAPIFNNCIIIAGDGGTENIGAYILSNSRAIFNNCFIQAGSDGTDSNSGVATDSDSIPIFNSCVIRAGYRTGLDFSRAIQSSRGSNPTFNSCIIQWGDKFSFGVLIDFSSSGKFNGCIISPLEHAYYNLYASANNGRFQPFADNPYQLVGFQIFRGVAQAPGVTLNVGTTIGGSEIAANIPLDGLKGIGVAFNRVEIAAAGYMYFTPSVPVAEEAFTANYSVIINLAGCSAIYMDTKGYGVFEGCTIMANGASDVLEIKADSVTTKNWKVVGSHLETLDPVNQKAVNAAAAITAAPIYGCTFVGGLTNITSFAAPVIVGADIQMPAGGLVDGVDVSAHVLAVDAHVAELLATLLKGSSVLHIPTTGWTAVVVNGATEQTPSRQSVSSSATVSSSALLYTSMEGFGKGTANVDRINWDKKLYLIFNYSRINSNVEGITRLQLKRVNTIGVLAAKGIGIRADNYVLVGESFGTELGEVALGVTLTSQQTITLAIVHDPSVPKIEWWIDGVLMATQSTAAKIPSGVGGGLASLVSSAANGATEGLLAVVAYLMHPKIWQVG